MALDIIRNCEENLTYGETKIYNKIRSLYSNYKGKAYLYIQPNLSSLKPDFILIDEYKGLSIIEVKDWEMKYIKSINKREVELEDRIDKNPVFKTKKYLDLLIGRIALSDLDLDFLERNIFANTILVNITSSEIEELNITENFNQNPIKCITKNLIDKITINDLFSNDVININKNEIVLLRTFLFPETKIKKEMEEINSFDIFSLDIEQENFARRLSYGHYMVTGVPGSGKTLILVSRAIHLIKENPNWKIKILTYNKSLTLKIENILNNFIKETENDDFYNNFNIQNIEVQTFHSLAMELLGERGSKDSNWFENEFPLKLEEKLENIKPIFDAILIDEYQDFRDIWLKFCIKLCKEHNYKDNANKDTKGINLFLAGDRLQSIYNPKVHNWKDDFNLNMQGRSKLLKVSYRAGKENITLALKFLQKNKELANEVNNFYKEDDEERLNISNICISDSVNFIEGSYACAINTIKSLLEEGYNYNDILLICKNNYDCNKIYNLFPDNIKTNTTFMKESNNREINAKILLTTYHSSKGLEAPIVILIDTHKFKEDIDKNKEILDRKLLYVGMTRASKKLFIHAENFNYEGFSKILKDTYNK